jgi:hypothetical protein
MGIRRHSPSQTLEFVNPGAASFSGGYGVHLIGAGFKCNIGCAKQFSTVTAGHKHAGYRYSLGRRMPPPKLFTR